MTSLEQYLVDAGFVDVKLNLKEESREIISQWLPGSGELHLVSISYSSAVQDRSNTYTPLSLFAVPIHSCLLSGKKSFPD